MFLLGILHTRTKENTVSELLLILYDGFSENKYIHVIVYFSLK